MNVDGRNATLDLARQAQLRPDAPALSSNGRSLSYRELDGLCWRASAFLSEHGLSRGDVIALNYADDFALAVAMLGAARMGVTYVPIPKATTAHQNRKWAAAAGCRALVTDAPERFDAGLPTVRLTVADCSVGRRASHSLLDETPAAPLMINIGSGSTGAPKLIRRTHGNMNYRNQVSAASPVFAEEDRTLWMTSLASSAVQSRLYNLLHVGKTLVLLPEGNYPLGRFLSEQSVTVLICSVYHLESILRLQGESHLRAFAELRAVRTGGSNVTDSLRARVRNRLNPNFFVEYATNETGIASVCPPDGHSEASGSIGRPLPGVEMEVVAAPGEVGAVRIRNPGVVDGYLGDGEANRSRFVGGWFLPGDLAARSASGCFVYYGRSDHMMIVNGINLYPAEIEICLADHPAVADAAAVPLAHEVHNHVPVCAVALREGAELVSNELEDFARQRLGYRGPKRIFVLPRIPRNPQGKLIRQELMDAIRNVI